MKRTIVVAITQPSPATNIRSTTTTLRFLKNVKLRRPAWLVPESAAARLEFAPPFDTLLATLFDIAETAELLENRIVDTLTTTVIGLCFVLSPVSCDSSGPYAGRRRELRRPGASRHDAEVTEDQGDYIGEFREPSENGTELEIGSIDRVPGRAILPPPGREGRARPVSGF
jgi:hypothetical protein